MSSSDPVLASLRAATRAEHDRIEAILRLTEPMSLARYGAVMTGFDAFLHAWEPLIQAALPQRLHEWFHGRRRSAFARTDVDWLRSQASVSTPPPDVACVAALRLAEPADVLGSLYVIEGSALGGRVIAPHLQATLGLGVGHGASYFHGFGDATGAMWRDFRILAGHEIGDAPGARERACDSARRTFGALIEIFAPLAPTPN